MLSSILLLIELYTVMVSTSGGVLNQTAVFFSLIAIVFAVYAIDFVLMGIGLYHIAKRDGIKHAYLAFIPFANIYFIGKIAGRAKVFGKSVKNIGVYTLIFFVAYLALSLTSDILLYGENLKGMFVNNDMGVLPEFYGSFWVDGVLNIAIIIASLCYIVSNVFMLSTFFLYYANKNRVLYLLLSIFIPISTGLLVFISRKSKRFDFSNYMKMQFDKYNGMRSGGGFNNPDQPFIHEEEKSPFSEYEKKEKKSDDIDVFEDYSDKNTPKDDLFWLKKIILRLFQPHLCQVA